MSFVLAMLASTAMVGPQVPDAAAPSGPAEVSEVVVTGRVQRLYRTRETTVGKGPADPLDIPQAVTVLNEELYRDQGARDAADLYRNIAGVSFFSYSGVTFRGFRQATGEIYYDNLRGNPFIGFSVPQLFNIERVEVLKGPAGMLYGPGSPGGLINYVTKTPEEERAVNATLVAGDYGRRGVSAEATGPLDSQGRVLARAGAFYEFMEPFRRNTNIESGIYDAGLTVRPADWADVILQATRYDQKLNGNRLRGVPVTDGGDFLTAVEWNHNEPGDHLDLKADVYQARLVLRPAEGVRANLAVRTFEAEERQQYHEPRGLTPDGLRMIREFRDQARGTEGTALGGDLSVETAALGLKHTVLAGFDLYEEEAGLFSRVARTNVLPLSLRDPAYGASRPETYRFNPPSDTLTRTERRGVYLQDQVALTERFSVLAGVRHDSFRDESLNRLTGVRTPFEDSDLTFRAGAIYKPRPDVSLYASWSEGFEPQSASSQDVAVGGPFDPVRGEQIEAGVKVALLNGRVQGQAAVYEIKRRDLLQDIGRDPGGDGRNDLAPLGEVTSTGFEAEVAADVTPNWVVTAVYAYNDARITATRAGGSLDNAVGDRFANAPEHQFGFWTRYEIDRLGLAVALGGQYLSERVSLDRQRVKPYAVFDASVVKRLGERVEALLRIDNLLDETYAASGFTRTSGHFPGEPRSAFLEVRARY